MSVARAGLLLLSACTGGVGHVPSTPTTRPPDTDPPPTDGPTDGPTVETAHTGLVETADTGDAPDPCDGIPPAPLSVSLLGGVPSTEEFHFDATGLLWSASSDDQAVYQTPYGGVPTLLAPFASVETAGARVTPDGTGLAVCDEWDGAVVRVDLTTGATTTIVSGIDSPNSIGFDDRGYLYIAAYGQVLRTPVDGGTVEVLVDQPFADFDGITFSPDYDIVYFNHDEGGEVGQIELDAAGNVLAVGLLAFVSGIGWSSELDGMATDACGNVYVIVTSGEVVRIDPKGTVSPYHTVGGNAWTTALNFGSGVGGWARDRLYVMDRSNGLVELEVGVAGRPEVHLP